MAISTSQEAVSCIKEHLIAKAYDIPGESRNYQEFNQKIRECTASYFEQVVEQFPVEALRKIQDIAIGRVLIGPSKLKIKSPAIFKLYISEHRHKIKKLKLDLELYENRDLSEIVSMCPNLELLYIQSTKLTDQGLFEIFQKIPFLKTLKVSSSKDVTMEGLMPFIEKNPKLMLFIEACEKITWAECTAVRGQYSQCFLCNNGDFGAAPNTDSTLGVF